MDPHDQYNKHPEASPEFGNKNRDRYDNEVFYTDLVAREIADLGSGAAVVERHGVDHQRRSRRGFR